MITIFIIILLIYYFFKKPKKYKINGKVCFLFLIYEDLNYEDLWYDFFKNADKNKYNIFIHYKKDKKLKYFENYKLPKDKLVETKWGTFSLVQAQNILLKEGLKDKMNKKFIFISGSTIPIKDFNYVFKINMEDNFSHFSLYKNQLKIKRCNYLINKLGRKNIVKVFQWCILNRKHCKMVVDNENIYKNFLQNGVYDYDTCIPDEHHYITYLIMNGEKQNLIQHYFTNYNTYVDWFRGAPYEFKQISDKELNYLLNSNFMFARKFKFNSLKDNQINFLKNSYIP